MKKINLVLIITILLSVCSCKTGNIPIENTRTEYKYIYSTDTIIQNSTTYIKEKGDTIYIKETREVYKYRDRIDTCIVNDTIVEIEYRDKIVEVNNLKDWQIILMVLGGILLGIIGYKLLRIIK